MFLIRSADPADVEAVLKLARCLDSYNLPADRRELRKLVSVSAASFGGGIKEKDRLRFLFVAEEIRTGRVAGCSLILARHGTPRRPHLSFKLGTETKHSRFLSKTVRHLTLTLSADTAGFTEIGGLVVLPRYRGTKEKLAKQLSYARFCYMAGHPRRFMPRILVEYLSPTDPRTGNKLWAYLGKNFTGLSYHEADRLSAVSKEFILSLFPREKIYGSILPFSALRCIGTLSEGAKASLRMLEKQRFRYVHQVDPFDGGPHYAARFNEVPLIQRTAALRYEGSMPAGALVAGRGGRGIVLREFDGKVRAVTSEYRQARGGIRLPEDNARLLGASAGERLFVTAF